jgi:hypothetical protein
MITKVDMYISREAYAHFQIRYFPHEVDGTEEWNLPVPESWGTPFIRFQRSMQNSEQEAKSYHNQQESWVKEVPVPSQIDLFA